MQVGLCSPQYMYAGFSSTHRSVQVAHLCPTSALLITAQLRETRCFHSPRPLLISTPLCSVDHRRSFDPIKRDNAGMYSNVL